MFEMGLHDPFEYLRHKLLPKERSGAKMLIWLPSIKSWESLWNKCVQACHILLESSRWGLQFCFKTQFNRRLAQEVMALQSSGSFNFENFETPKLGVLGQNHI